MEAFCVRNCGRLLRPSMMEPADPPAVLEASSKMLQQDTDASEAHEAKEVFRMAFMARNETAVVL
jgi:hypothetical protein